MARRMPRRYKSGPKRGQFMPKAARKRTAPRKRKRNIGRTVARARTNAPAKKRRAATTRRPVARKRNYRGNPRRPNIIRTLTDGIVEAGQMLVGKAAVRTVPDLAGLPKQGNAGLAVQVATALVIGYAADMFLSRRAVSAITAGALSAPLETLIVATDIPWLGRALSPVTQTNSLGAYVQPRGVSPGMGRYVQGPKLSRVSSARGMGNGGY